MALHHTLPIYKVAKQLLRLTLDLPKHMRKDAKFLIGRLLRRRGYAVNGALTKTYRRLGI